MTETKTKKEGRIILYIACSVDGYIAAPNDDLSFLSIAEVPGEDYGYGDFMKGIQAVITGKTTYDWVKANANNFVHSDKEAYIITHDDSIQKDHPSISIQEVFDRENPQQNVRTYSGDITSLVKLLKAQGKNVFIEGGASIIHQLMQASMIDEFYIALIPVLLGKGTPLFLENFPEHKLQLEGVKSYDTGLAMLHYQTKPKLPC